MEYMASLGAGTVISTAGAGGCYAWLDGSMKHFAAFPVRAVDTTGAGDVFHGAFLAAWLEGQSTEACIRFASAVSALKCRKPGGRAGIPDRGEAEKFLERGVF